MSLFQTSVGPEIIGAVGIALDGTIDRGCADKRSLFRRAAWRLGVVEESVDVQVDTQLPHLTVIKTLKMCFLILSSCQM